MLELITGTPGAKKTVFTVSKLDKAERDNQVNLLKNITLYKQNLPLVDKFRSDFGYREFEVGGAHTLKREIEVLPDDYFDFLLEDFDDLRPDFYYQRASYFNEIIERINEREGEQKFKFILPVRTIYSNINALKIPFVRSLSELIDDNGFVDWRKAPDGSIIVIDEVQLVPPFDQVKNRNEPIIQDLTVHRHRGFDFKFITQYPSLLHPTIKDLIGVHFHLTVPYGVKTRVYQFGSTRAYPNTMANKFNCETKFYFSPPDRLFKLYKSTTIDTHKKRIPYKQLLGFAILILLGIGIFITSVMGGSKSAMFGGDSKKPALAAVDTVDNPLSPDAKPDALPSPSVPDAKPDTLPSPSVASSGVFDPLSGGYIKDVNLVPVSGMQFADRCSLYNKDDALLLHISHDDCVRYLSEKGMLPKVGNSISASSPPVATAPKPTPS